MNGNERTVRGAAVTWYFHPDGSRRIARLGDDIVVADDDVARFDSTNTVETEPSSAPAAVVAQEPPRAGKGSSRDAWATYAETCGIDVNDDMSRDDIIEAVDGARD